MPLLKDAILKKIKKGLITPEKKKLVDGDGLYIQLRKLSNGDIGMYWRFDFSYAKKRKTYTIGKYPLISTTKARQVHNQKRVDIAMGIDPAKQKKALKQSSSDARNFKTVALMWLKDKEGGVNHKASIERFFKNDIFPVLGAMSVDEILPTDVVKLVKRLGDRGSLDQARRVGRWCYSIFKYGMTMGYADRNPADIDFSMILPVHISTPHASITDPKEIALLIVAIEHYGGYFITKCLLQLASLLMLRPHNLVGMEWSEIDFDNALYTIEARKMKSRQHLKKLNRKQDWHNVPLSKQALFILHEIQAMNNPSQYVFPHQRGKPTHMCTDTIRAALRLMGYDKKDMSGHGFRAMARTVLEEQLGIDEKILELQLGHNVATHGGAYDRTKHLGKRITMMQDWADYLDGLKSDADVVPIKKAD